MKKPQFHLANAGVLLTGASGGIGEAIARVLADAGARLVLTGRNREQLERVAGSVRADVTVIPADLSSHDGCAELLRAAEQALGGVDVLVNNAGLEHAAYYEDLPLGTIDEMVQVNLLAPMHLSALCLPGMLRRNRGRIVNIASVAGLTGVGFSEPYCATKHGLVGFTRSLRASLISQATDVRAAVVCPGFVTDAGMYEKTATLFNVRASRALGQSAPESVAMAVRRAVTSDLAEVIVNSTPMRPLLALGMVSPPLAAWVNRLFKADAYFKEVADHRRRLKLRASEAAVAVPARSTTAAPGGS